jgi:hypothetical protein
MESMNEKYKCMKCGTDINEGEYETFGVCDSCYDKSLRKISALEARQERLEAENLKLKEALREINKIAFEEFYTEFELLQSIKSALERDKSLL